MDNVIDTIISQYGNSPRLLQMINDLNTCIDPRVDFNNFYNIVWNVETAVGFGLDIWGRIVGVSRDLTLTVTPLFFGFKEAVPGSYPFGEEPFYTGAPAATNTYSLSDDYFRKLILAKALANISATNAKAINAVIQYLFVGEGRCYCNDMGHMQMRYTFEFALADFERAVISQTKVFPVPAGVQAHVLTSPFPLFGFSEAGSSAAGFGQAVFLPTEAILAIV